MYEHVTSSAVRVMHSGTDRGHESEVTEAEARESMNREQ